jgi:hypothetical protein
MLMLTSNGREFKEITFDKEEDFSVMLLTYIKDQPSIMISSLGKNNKHPHLESLENFYRIVSDNKGEELI